MLTKPGQIMGAGVEDILDSLGLPEPEGRIVLYSRLSELHERLRPLGLAVRHNPVDHVFFLDTNVDTVQVFKGTSLPDRLAATLLVVITLSYQENGWVELGRVKEFRRKNIAGLRGDLNELATLGYVEFDKSAKMVRPGHRVPFEIDYETFFRRLAES